MLLNRLRADEIMDRDGLSAIVATTPLNTYYLSNYGTDASWGFGDLALVVLPRDDRLKPAVITVEADSGQPQQRSGPWMDLVLGYARRPGIGAGGVQGAMTTDGLPPDQRSAVAAYLRDLGLDRGKVAFEDRGLGLDVAEDLGGTLTAVGARDLLRDIRMVKTPRELSLMRTAARKTDLALIASAEAIAAGANCAEAERVFWSVTAQIGGRPMFLLITPYRADHGRMKKTDSLQPGDTVTFDATAEFDHYTSDIGRTAVIGEPTAHQLRVYNATRKGWVAAQAEFRPGEMSDDVERRVVAHVQAAGNPQFKGCNVHSIGLEHTDHPHPGSALSPFRLVDGMVLSCDLPFIGPDVGKFHFEDEVYLKDGRVEIINDSDGRLLACVDGRTLRVDG